VWLDHLLSKESLDNQLVVIRTPRSTTSVSASDAV
jgi:hypothetical protein